MISTNASAGKEGHGDEEEQVHDQLPSVEDVRIHAATAVQSTSALSLDNIESAPMSHANEGVSTPDGSRAAANHSLEGTTEVRSARRRHRIVLVSAVMAIVCFILAITLARRKETFQRYSSPSRVSAVNDWLATENISTSEDLSNFNRPQFQAAYWIADVDDLQVPLPLDGESKTAFVQRYVLAVLAFAMGVDDWTFNVGFLTKKPTCLWNQEIGGSETIPVGALCNNEQEVFALYLPDNNLVGTLPPEIGDIGTLSYIVLNDNAIAGTLPETMAKLNMLIYLALHYNELSGNLPTWLGVLNIIRVIGLGNNNFQGSIPESFAQLSDLMLLGLDDNKLTGDLTVLQGLEKIESLYLEDNAFTGSLDFIAMPHLKELDVSTNALYGTIPPHIFGYQNLTVLDLHNNTLNGTIPKNIPSNEMLTLISLHSNLLTGIIPSALANIENVTHMDLSFNLLTGEFPTELGSMNDLEYLFLAGNNFQAGPIPSWLQNLTALTDLSLHSTGRSGTIPSWLGTISNLLLLDLFNNTLEGAIPPSLSQLSSLSFLFLGHNQLNGTVPDSVQNMTSLGIFLLDQNNLTGSVDNFCNNTPKLPVVMTADCDRVPEITCSCCTLCCSDNRLDCNNDSYIGELDPIWENSYKRDYYVFESLDVVFSLI